MFPMETCGESYMMRLEDGGKCLQENLLMILRDWMPISVE